MKSKDLVVGTIYSFGGVQYDRNAGRLLSTDLFRTRSEWRRVDPDQVRLEPAPAGAKADTKSGGYYNATKTGYPVVTASATWDKRAEAEANLAELDLSAFFDGDKIRQYVTIGKFNYRVQVVHPTNIRETQAEYEVRETKQREARDQAREAQQARQARRNAAIAEMTKIFAEQGVTVQLFAQSDTTVLVDVEQLLAGVRVLAHGIGGTR